MKVSEGTAPISVLLIDDDEDGAEMMVAVLELKGYRAESARSVDEGLERYHGGQHDVVVSDLNLRDRSGFDVATELSRTEGGGPLLIALTGAAELDAKARSFEAGFDHYVTKPVDWDKLGALLDGLRS